MPVSAVISDWNGTLITYPDEGKLWKHVGMGLLKESAYNLRPVRTARLLRSMLRLQELANQYKSGETGYEKIYELYNREVLNGAPLGLVHKLIWDYAEKPETQEAIDSRLLDAILQYKRNGKITGVFSTGSKLGIRKALNKRTNSYDSFPQIVEANELKKEGDKDLEFSLDIYNNKGEKFEELIVRKHGIAARTTAYIGNTPEDEGGLIL